LIAKVAQGVVKSTFSLQTLPMSRGGGFVDRLHMTQSIICSRAFEFAIRTVKLCERMAARGFGARHIAHQLIRCGTSIGANAEEAQEGQSKADYIAKMCVSSKEARETAYWLRLGVAVSSVTTSEVEWELKEANELRFMIRAAVRTARSSTDRGRS